MVPEERSLWLLIQITNFALFKNTNLLSNTPLLPPIGHSFSILPSVDSSNNYAMAQLDAGLAQHGSVYLALEQWAGKGQRGRPWITLPGENIMMTVVLDPAGLEPSQGFFVAATIALGCYDFFKKHAGRDETRIKWPNDIYWQDRKAGGILIETQFGKTGKGDAGWKWIVAGMGINLNQVVFDERLKNPVSLRQISGRSFDLIEMSRQLCDTLEFWYRRLVEKDFDGIFYAYNEVLYKKDQPVDLLLQNDIISTRILGVSREGKLQTEAGEWDSWEARIGNR